MIETEAKIELEEKEFRNLADRLGNPEFKIQKNLLYNLGKGFIRFRNEDRKSKITIKGEKLKGEYNSRHEIEFGIPNMLFSFFPRLNGVYYEKFRAFAKMNECDICLDILDGKNYIEIEGEKENIRKSLVELGLENKPIERRSYLEIVKNDK